MRHEKKRLRELEPLYPVCFMTRYVWGRNLGLQLREGEMRVLFFIDVSITSLFNEVMIEDPQGGLPAAVVQAVEDILFLSFQCLSFSTYKIAFNINPNQIVIDLSVAELFVQLKRTAAASFRVLNRISALVIGKVQFVTACPVGLALLRLADPLTYQ